MRTEEARSIQGALYSIGENLRRLDDSLYSEKNENYQLSLLIGRLELALGIEEETDPYAMTHFVSWPVRLQHCIDVASGLTKLPALAKVEGVPDGDVQSRR